MKDHKYKNISNIKAHGLMLLTMVLVSSSFPVATLITNGLPPAIMMFIRFSLAALLFAPYVFIKNKFSFPPLKKAIHYLILSTPLVIFFWCMFESLRYTTPLNTGALYTLVPAITAIYAFFINKEHVSRIRAGGLLLGTLGAIWIVFRGDYNSLISLDLNYGDFIFLLGSIIMAVYNPLIKKFYGGEPMEIMTFWVLLFGALLLLIISGTSILDVEWSNIDTSVYIGIAYLSIFTTLTTFFLLQICIVIIGPTRAAAYSFLTPILIILLSIFIGKNQFDIIILPGIIAVGTAMLIIQKVKK